MSVNNNVYNVLGVSLNNIQQKQGSLHKTPRFSGVFPFWIPIPKNSVFKLSGCMQRNHKRLILFQSNILQFIFIIWSFSFFY